MGSRGKVTPGGNLWVTGIRREGRHPAASRPLEINRTASSRPRLRLLRLLAPRSLPRAVATCQQALTMSPCRRRAAPSRREPSTVPPARGTSVRPAVTRVRYFLGPKDGPNKFRRSGRVNRPRPCCNAAVCATARRVSTRSCRLLAPQGRVGELRLLRPPS